MLVTLSQVVSLAVHHFSETLNRDLPFRIPTAQYRLINTSVELDSLLFGFLFINIDENVGRVSHPTDDLAIVISGTSTAK